MSDEEVERVFIRLRWSSNDGKPFCPRCGCTTVYGSRRKGAPRWQWCEDPGLAIPPEITNITGITDEMVAGHRIDERAVNDLMSRVVLVIAHNADFGPPLLGKAASRLRHQTLGVQPR